MRAAWIVHFSLLLGPALSGCLVDPAPLEEPIREYTRESDWSQWASRVATFNIWGLPLVSKDLDERVAQIGRELRSLNLDFAFLQEGWRESDRKRIALDARFGFDAYFDVARTAGSGLFSLSTIPIARTSFREFSLNGALEDFDEADAYTGKGVGMASITLRGLPISLFNTHCIARYGSDGDVPSDRHTLDRLLQIFEIFRHIVEQTDSDAFVLAGDLNLRFFHEEYEFLRNLTSLDGIRAEESDSGACTLCADNDYNSRSEGQIDYIFTSPRLRIKRYRRDFDKPFARKDGRKIHLSDHYGWVAEIEAMRSTPTMDPALVRAKTLRSIQELRGRLEHYLANYPGPEQPKGIEDRICRKCRIQDALEVIGSYERALGTQLKKGRESVLRLRLEGYFNLWREPSP